MFQVRPESTHKTCVFLLETFNVLVGNFLLHCRTGFVNSIFERLKHLSVSFVWSGVIVAVKRSSYGDPVAGSLSNRCLVNRFIQRIPLASLVHELHDEDFTA